MVSLLLLLHHKFSSFLGRNLHFVPYSLVAVHTWLLVLEPDLAYVMCQQSAGRCPYLGNTPVSLFTYVDGDIGCKYILGISQGCSLGSDLQAVSCARQPIPRILPPAVYVRTRVTCRLASVDAAEGEARSQKAIIRYSEAS